MGGRQSAVQGARWRQTSPRGRRRSRARRRPGARPPGWPRSVAPWCSAVLLGGARGGLTPFTADPTQEGVARFQQDIFISESFLEPDDGSCSSMSGPQCSGLHGRQPGVAPGGIFSMFGSLPGDPGFFVQDEVAAYFASGMSGEEAEVGPGAASGPAPGAAGLLGAPPPARCLRVAFGGLPPHLQRLPGSLKVAGNLTMEAVGTFALVTSRDMGLPFGRPGAANTSSTGVGPRVHVEVQGSISYFRFTGPVVMEQVWVAREPGATGNSSSSRAQGEAAPIVLRGRNGADEQWSAYLRESDFQNGWVSPLSITPLPIKEIVILGGAGLRIASLLVSQVLPAAEESPAAASSPRNGWLISPMEGLRSLHDLALSRLPLPSAAAVLSLAEVHSRGHLRLRRSLFAEGPGWQPPPLAPAAAEELLAVPPAEEDAAVAQAAAAEHAARFSDGRSLTGLRALLDALQTGSFAFPRDVPLEALEADVRMYGAAIGGVTLEEAANARGLDELHERLFTANRMDALDLLYLRFLWANHTAALRVPGGTMHGSNAPTAPVASGNLSVVATSQLKEVLSLQLPEEAAEPEPEVEAKALDAPLLAQDETGKRRRSVISNLKRYTALYTRWRWPIETKTKFLSSSGASEVSFALYDNANVLGIDYYNAASGRGRHAEIEVPDAEYLLAELLGMEQDLLVDGRGRPLPEGRAAKEHNERSYLAELGSVLEELRRETAEVPLDATPPSAGEGGVVVPGDPGGVGDLGLGGA